MSEKNLEKDILQPIPLDDWPILQSKIKEDWPKFAYIYYWVENALRWKKRDPDTPIQMYCPNGDRNSDTIVGISTFSLYLVLLFSREASGDTLKKILSETKRIDWNAGVYFIAVHDFIFSTVHSTIKSFETTRGVEIDSVTPGNYHYKSAEDCLAVEIKVPEECYLKRLEKTDIPTIHEVWPHKDPDRPDLSMKYLTTMVELNDGVGLYLKKDDSLVSWALHTDWYGIGMVQTLKEHKRKGYARTVINALAKKFGEEGISSTLFIVKGNVTSEKMFQGLGWKSMWPVAWIVTKRKRQNDVNVS